MLKFFFIVCFIFFNFWKFQFILLLMVFLLFFIYPMFNSSIFYFFLLDNMSYGFILLTFWIFILMIMASENIFYLNNFLLLFLLNLLLLLLFLLLSFMMNNLMLFYLFFEMSLIPILFMIMGWGYQPERIQAGLYLLFYTLFASLPMLLGILWMYFNNINLMFFLMKFDYFNLFYKFFYFIMIFAFLVKMPMFLVHLWLPKAHVEAPISGSMILAGVLLKLGGYGLLRILMFLMKINLKFSFYIISVSLLGGVLISLNCLRQIDFKSLIAYSSIVHMSLVLGGILTFSYWGMNMSFMMMIGHGLCSSGLFCLANISYERLFSRSLLINKGLMNLMSLISMWWFLLCSSNMSAPLSLNLVSEIGLLNSLISWSYFSIFLLFFISFFSAAYCLYLFSYSQHGNYFFGKYNYFMNNIREFLLLILHWLPLNLMFLKMDLFFIF